MHTYKHRDMKVKSIHHLKSHLINKMPKVSVRQCQWTTTKLHIATIFTLFLNTIKFWSKSLCIKWLDTCIKYIFVKKHDRYMHKGGKDNACKQEWESCLKGTALSKREEIFLARCCVKYFQYLISFILKE